MTYHAHVEHGALVLDTPAALPEGARFSLRPLRAKGQVKEEGAAAKKAWLVSLSSSLTSEEREEAKRIGDDILRNRKVDAELWA